MLSILIVFALLNTGKWLINFISTPYEPIDFRGCYLSAEAYWNGMDPYSYEDQKKLWEPIQSENHDWKMIENGVYSTPLYPPQFVAFFGLYSLLSFKVAIWLQWILNIFAIGLIIWSISKLNQNLSVKYIVLGIMAFRGTWYALDTGQPMLQVFALAMYVLVLIERKNLSLLPGLLLGFISFKYTLLIPFGLYLLYKKEYKIVSIWIGLSVLLNAILLILDMNAQTHIQSWLNSMQLMNNYLHQDISNNGLAIIATSISIPVSQLFKISESVSSGPFMILVRIILPLVPFVFIWMYRKKFTWQYLIFISSLCSICFGHHLIYDVLTLISLRLISIDKNSSISSLEFTLLILLVIPLGKLVEISHINQLHFLPAVYLFFYFIVQVIRIIKHQNLPILNTEIENKSIEQDR
ncbi:MAG: glycosyltransferase 87 family protein [Bacteroidia bacterium]